MFEVNQTRTHNAANEILTISGGNTLVSHDRNGCMTRVPKPLDGTEAYTLVYEAWNRLISVSDGDTLVATYMYDARNHRIKKTVGDETRLYYFNQQWQCVEERVGTTVDATWIYGLRYIDDIVCRTTSNSGETQTLYALQDTNWNVVALVTPSGVVAERITYDSFGKPSFRNANFTAKTASSYNWSKAFTGQTYDVETGLMLYRNRYYHTGLGGFITRDPIGYEGDNVNFYRYVGNSVPTLGDSSGFSCESEFHDTVEGCNDINVQCNKDCMKRTPPWPFGPKRSWAHYSYCEAMCQKDFMRCWTGATAILATCQAAELARQTGRMMCQIAEYSFDTLVEATNWLADHPEIAALWEP